MVGLLLSTIQLMRQGQDNAGLFLEHPNIEKVSSLLFCHLRPGSCSPKAGTHSARRQLPCFAGDLFEPLIPHRIRGGQVELCCIVTGQGCVFERKLRPEEVETPSAKDGSHT